MVSHLAISLRQAADTSLTRVWDGDHFTAVESVAHEMIVFANPPPLPTPSSPLSNQDLKQPSRRGDLLGPCSEA